MLRKIVLPVLALAGVLFGSFMVFFSAKKPPVSPVPFPPPVSPYEHYLAGDGIVEAVRKNTLIGTSFDEIVTEIYVSTGDVVKKGDPLFKIDTRALDAQLVRALEEQSLAEVDYKNQQVQFSFFEKLKQKAAVSKQAYQAAFYAGELAKKRLDTAMAAVDIIKTNIARSTTYAPTDGKILQINVHLGQSVNRVGQSISGTSTSTIPIIFGDTSSYHLRVDIDEEDAWRFVPGSPATAFVRSNAKLRIPLEFVYLEPYVVPKKSLSGLGTERVDTRVLQVVYKFSQPTFPVFVGQQLDVYIEAKPSGISA